MNSYDCTSIVYIFDTYLNKEKVILYSVLTSL